MPILLLASWSHSVAQTTTWELGSELMACTAISLAMSTATAWSTAMRASWVRVRSASTACVIFSIYKPQ